MRRIIRRVTHIRLQHYCHASSVKTNCPPGSENAVQIKFKVVQVVCGLS